MELTISVFLILTMRRGMGITIIVAVPTKVTLPTPHLHITVPTLFGFILNNIFLKEWFSKLNHFIMVFSKASLTPTLW